MATTIFTVALDANAGNYNLWSWRTAFPVTAGAEDQIRVRFVAQTDQSMVVTNASIAISTQDTITTGTEDATATPVELLFSGVSGFTIAATETITSDWVNFTGFTSSDLLLVTIDHGATGYFRAKNSGLDPTYHRAYYTASVPHYADADVTTLGSFNGACAGFDLVETQAAAAGQPAIKRLGGVPSARSLSPIGEYSKAIKVW